MLTNTDTAADIILGAMFLSSSMHCCFDCVGVAGVAWGVVVGVPSRPVGGARGSMHGHYVRGGTRVEPLRHTHSLVTSLSAFMHDPKQKRSGSTTSIH